MNAVTYLRYSHDKQNKSFSIEEQKAACIQFAQHLNATIIQHFVDRAQSAKTTNRTALVEMMNFVTNPKNLIDTIIVYDMSRISRNSLDFLLIKKALSKSGIVFRSANGMSDETPEGSLAQDIMTRFAQYENEIKAIKVKGGMHARFKAGYALRRVIGYKWEKDGQGKSSLVPDDEFEAVKKIWIRTAKEKLTIFQAVKLSNKLLPKSKMTKSTLSRMFANKLYFGVLSYPTYSEEVIGVHKPMVDEETYWQIREMMTGRSHKNTTTRTKINPLYPLTKTLLCPKCDGKITAAKSKGKHKSYDYYFCRNRKECKYNVQVEKVHEAFVTLLKLIKPSEEMMVYMKELMKEKYESYYNDLSTSSKTVEADLTRLIDKKKKALELVVDGTLSNMDYKELVQRIDNETLALKILINEKKMEKIDIETILNFVTFYTQNIEKIWTGFGIEVKLALQSSTFPKGVYFEENVCRTPEIGAAFDVNRALDSLGDPNDSYVEHLLKEYHLIYNALHKQIPMINFEAN
jgi:DNA invertase Pin-like site-specific DNA recombinase